MYLNRKEYNSGSPFFSIGVPTYNRPDLLKQTLKSIQGQTFKDFEVIVGNDYTKENLSSGLLGIDDSRIKFVNHPLNLGELGNMNALLGMGRGKYFTWQFDDDLYSPDFLEAVYSALTEYNFPQCVYSSYGYIYGSSFPRIAKNTAWPKKLFSGREFLKSYLSGKFKAMGCCGVFEAECLKKIGGVEHLCDNPIGAHSEHLLLIRAGLLKKVAYINIPLVFYREHKKSWSCSGEGADAYKQAGENLIKESAVEFLLPELRDDFKENIANVLRLSLDSVIGKLIARDGYLNKKEFKQYLSFIKKYFENIEDLSFRAEALRVFEEINKENKMNFIIKAKFKSKAPLFIVEFFCMVRAFMSWYKHRFI